MRIFVIQWSLIYGLCFLSLQVSGESASTSPWLILPAEPNPARLADKISYYAAALGIDSSAIIRVTYSLRMDDKKRGLIQYQNAGIGPRHHQILIYLNRRSPQAQRSIALAHEMVHAAQYVRGDLVKASENDFHWRGQLFANVHRLRYASRPWEQEAQQIGEQLRKAYLQSKPITEPDLLIEALEDDHIAIVVLQ